jgi:ribosome biogenesis GTPase
MTESMSTLEALGWERYRAHVHPEIGDDIVLGRVRRVDRGESDVLTNTGQVRALSDSVRAQSDLAPATGDWVALVDDPDLGLVIGHVMPRRTAIVRRDPAEEVVEQVLVANADVVGVIVGVDRPLNIARIERFLVLAADSGAAPLVVLTKTDLGVSTEWTTLPDEIPDVPVVATSAVSGSGIEAVKQLISDGQTLVLLGESGSGKSTLVNALVGDDVQATREVRERDAKGRHTTTARELVLVPGGGVLIDTPGVRGVGLWDAEPAVERVFSDIGNLADGCRFSDCRHEMEPGCAVKAAVASGEMHAGRLRRYLRLRAELDEQAEMREERRRKQRGRRP